MLEMLAALAVLAVCSSVLVAAFGQSARALQQAQRSDRLSLTARSLMAEANVGRLQAGVTEGRWSGVTWRLNVSALAAGNAHLRPGDSSLSSATALGTRTTARCKCAAPVRG